MKMILTVLVAYVLLVQVLTTNGIIYEKCTNYKENRRETITQHFDNTDANCKIVMGLVDSAISMIFISDQHFSKC